MKKMKIRIIGCGCHLCNMLEKNVLLAAERIGIEYEYSKVCDYETRMTPILFVDERLVSAGKVLSVVELEDKLGLFMQQID